MTERRYGEEIFSFVSEDGLASEGGYSLVTQADSMNPLMIVLRNNDDERWAAEAFAS